MKKILFAALISFTSFFTQAQIVLTRAYTPQNGAWYFELANNSTTSVNLGCYTLINYYNNYADRGFYVMSLPGQTLPGKGIVTIGTTDPAYQNSYGARINLSLKDLFAEGLLQRHVLDPDNNSF